MAEREFYSLVCCRCATVFHMDMVLRDRRREDGDLFYCPNGHPQVFTEAGERKSGEKARREALEKLLLQMVEWLKSFDDANLTTDKTVTVEDIRKTVEALVASGPKGK